MVGGMSRTQLLALHGILCAKGQEIMSAKNQDYTAGGGCFDNFRNAEVLGVPGELGLLIRVMDKLMRMKSFIVNGTLAVQSESVEDAIIDVINYMVLLAGMIKEKEWAQPGPAETIEFKPLDGGLGVHAVWPTSFGNG